VASVRRILSLWLQSGGFLACGFSQEDSQLVALVRRFLLKAGLLDEMVSDFMV
jgi:hypothetical protein